MAAKRGRLPLRQLRPPVQQPHGAQHKARVARRMLPAALSRCWTVHFHPPFRFSPACNLPSHHTVCSLPPPASLPWQAGDADAARPATRGAAGAHGAWPWGRQSSGQVTLYLTDFELSAWHLSLKVRMALVEVERQLEHVATAGV